MRFAILKEVAPNEFVEAIKGYTSTQFLSRLTAKLNEQFLRKENYWKRMFTRAQCLKLAQIAYNNCIEDLKEETIRAKP